MSRQEVTPVGTIEIKQNCRMSLVGQGAAGVRVGLYQCCASALLLISGKQNLGSSGMVFRIHAVSRSDCIAAWLRMAAAICAYHLAGAEVYHVIAWATPDIGTFPALKESP